MIGRFLDLKGKRRKEEKKKEQGPLSFCVVVCWALVGLTELVSKGDDLLVLVVEHIVVQDRVVKVKLLQQEEHPRLQKESTHPSLFVSFAFAKLCLSRACLGKMIIFSLLKWCKQAKDVRFPSAHRVVVLLA